mmetsp:Transcript_667/g.1538  ORF Transcript_667/g.1538 Transcript_667/m.1538 type:complete len:228 (+) Transcript_667:372-1055(+)
MLRSGRPALLCGHAQKGVDGTQVIMATPSLGLVSRPLWGSNAGLHIPQFPDNRCIDTILSYGTLISTLPIQNLRPPSDVMSTQRTELYQNHATATKFPIDIETTVPCRPIGTAATSTATNIASRRKNLNLNANENGAGVKLSMTEPSSVTYVKVCAIRRGSSGSTTGCSSPTSGGKFNPTPSTICSSSIVALPCRCLMDYFRGLGRATRRNAATGYAVRWGGRTCWP